ncbi:MAG: glycoside hydrolase family 25 protein [Prevotellaceae bacterium]|jgi:lysozyme|nr:glycoside hydrolase family 25 protein [Prevotellaceae bacterium]
MEKLLLFVLLFSLNVSAQSRETKRGSAFGIAIPSYKVHGIDISRYQEKIDWKSLSTLREGKDSIGISFAFVKATEGRTMRDKYFARNWTEARKHNIIRGAYHYYKPNVYSGDQAENFIRTVKLRKGDLPPVLDIEETGKYGAANMKKGVKNWLLKVEKHYGIRPVIYTNYHFYSQYLSGKEFKGYKFWIAHYTKHPEFDEWIFWQYSDKGVIKNISAKVAFSTLNGTLDDLKKLCKR